MTGKDAPTVRPALSGSHRMGQVEPRLAAAIAGLNANGDAEIDSLSPEGMRLEAQFRDLQADTDDLRAQVSALSAMVADMSPASTADTLGNVEEAAATAKARFRLAQEQEQQYLDDLDWSFAAEVPDPDWSDQASTAIDRVLGGFELSGVADFDLDCRSTLCRLEIEAGDSPLPSGFETQLAYSSLRPALTHTDESDGRRSAVVYLTREGFDLPPMVSRP